MRYLLDTNVVSENMKLHPNANVMSWLGQHGDECCACSIVIDELWYGMELLPEGRRKLALRNAIESLLAEGTDTVLPFDDACAKCSATLRAQQKLNGINNPAAQDSMIAGIAKTHELILVTRNVKDYAGMDIAIVNPFECVEGNADS